MSRLALGAALAAGLLAPATAALAGPSPQRTVRVRLAATGNPDGRSSQPSLSGDARRIAFTSEATNLVAADANGEVADVFVYDQGTSAVELVSSGSARMWAPNTAVRTPTLLSAMATSPR